ncbi:sigma-70 family RNA polymerase sigma factor [Microbispora rosea]|uniref:sigma-70 family RNA polymerase sigma factor n=1 Tax=Microbispora rosea TaxID=58117 RepID=UPI003D920772
MERAASPQEPPGDEAEFRQLVERHRREIYAHCYRMLGSVQDAEDALQESLLAAWRGLDGFEGRSSLRTWLFRVATNVCLQLSSRRPRRMLSSDHGPARSGTRDLGEPVTGPVWLEPWPDDLPADDEPDPAAAYLRRESVELAFVAALHGPPPGSSTNCTSWSAPPSWAEAPRPSAAGRCRCCGFWRPGAGTTRTT